MWKLWVQSFMFVSKVRISTCGVSLIGVSLSNRNKPPITVAPLTADTAPRNVTSLVKMKDHCSVTSAVR